MPVLCVQFDITMPYSEIYSESAGAFFYRLFIFSWAAAPATDTGMPVCGYTHSGIETPSYIKIAFSLNCEKPIFVGKDEKKAFPPRS